MPHHSGEIWLNLRVALDQQLTVDIDVIDRLWPPRFISGVLLSPSHQLEPSGAGRQCHPDPGAELNRPLCLGVRDLSTCPGGKALGCEPRRRRLAFHDAAQKVLSDSRGDPAHAQEGQFKLFPSCLPF